MIASRVVSDRMERKAAVKPTLHCFFVLPFIHEACCKTWILR
ncbi:hypothetical protein D922_00368 [Enterococcus faecalis 06-MB-DW-09]|nr:hypothetical protein D922_00368 [Enterococcus faecalis 06-MB-DW-09]